ncbi:serine/threonine-protein phosphatase, partial [Pseudomonas aeruginosa]
MVPNSVSYYRSASYSHVGMVRKVNEDASLDAPEAGLWVVGAGQGGPPPRARGSRRVGGTPGRGPAGPPPTARLGAG